MKTLPYLLAASCLLASCDDSKSHAGTRALREENEKLTAQLATQATDLKNKDRQIADLLQQLQQNIDTAAARRNERRQQRPADETGTPEEQASDTTAAAAEVPAVDPLSGLPAEVAQIITQQAAKNWPGDPTAQASAIASQAAAWRKMDAYDRSGYGNLPYADKQALVAEVRRHWSMDFEMQASIFEKQAAACLTVIDWARNGIPGVPFQDRQDVIDKAKKRWGSDWAAITSQIERAAGRVEK